LLVLVFQFGFLYKNELKKTAGFSSGIVAGAVDEISNLDEAKNFSLKYIEGEKNKIKENISLSRVFVKAAMEREKEENQKDQGD